MNNEINDKLIEEVVNELDGMKLLANSGELSYNYNNKSRLNLIFDFQDKFIDYAKKFIKDMYSTQDVKDFLRGLRLILNKYGYYLEENAYEFRSILIRPYNDIIMVLSNILSKSQQIMDFSKLNINIRKIKSRIPYMSIKDLIDSDVFIDKNVENKLINALNAFHDIANYVIRFASGGDTILNRKYNIQFSYYKEIADKAPLNIDFDTYDRISGYLKRNYISGNRDEERVEILKEYIINRVLETIKTLPELYSLQNITASDIDINTNFSKISIQLDSSYNKEKLKEISDTMYKYL